MSDLFLLIVAFGITFGLQHKVSFLWGKSKFLDSMLSCAYCTGFHAGWITWLLYISGEVLAESMKLDQLSWIDPILLAFASAGFAYLADAASRWMESNSEPLDEDTEEVDDVHH